MHSLRNLALLLLLIACSPASADDAHNSPAQLDIGLALGSGGAGGLAHIAMLQVFDELQIRPARISGSSIGAVIGVLYAAGLDGNEIHDIFGEFGGSNLDALSRLMRPGADLGLSDLLRLDLGNGGLLDSSGFIDFLKTKVEARHFADLTIPLEVVATDFWSGEMVVLKDGPLFPAIAASMAVPVLFSPVAVGEDLLVDGGTSNPLPFDLLTGRHARVVAIDVTGSRTPGESGEAEITDMLFNTFKIMQQSIIKARMLGHPPDLYLKPDTGNVLMLSFHRVEQTMDDAQPAAEQLREQLRSWRDERE